MVRGLSGQYGCQTMGRPICYPKMKTVNRFRMLLRISTWTKHGTLSEWLWHTAALWTFRILKHPRISLSATLAWKILPSRCPIWSQQKMATRCRQKRTMYSPKPKIMAKQFCSCHSPCLNWLREWGAWIENNPEKVYPHFPYDHFLI